MRAMIRLYKEEPSPKADFQKSVILASRFHDFFNLSLVFKAY